MPPKSKAKRKAEQASRRSVEVRKQQRLSSESAESSAAAVETPLSPSNLVPGAESSSSVSASTEELPGPSGLSTPTASSTASQSFEEEVAGVGGAGEDAVSERSFETEGTTTGPVEGVEGGTAGAIGPVQTDTKSSQEILGKFVEEWLQVLGKEEVKSVAMFLCYHLVSMFSFTETKAAEYAALLLNKSDRTVRRWRSGLIENDGVLPESEHGKHQRTGVLWKDEDLNKKATEYVRSNAAVKGRPNLTSIDFCRWVNETLLPNSTL